jgi:hypothetical protein
MDKENLVWNKVLATVMKMPGVKVDRVSFLRKELRPYCNQSRLQMIGSVRPYTVVSEEVVDKLAKQCVRNHTTLATATSAVVGLPGGLAMAATMPADLMQYFYHVFVLSQKLAYLYGYPDFFAYDDENEDDDEKTADEGEMSDVAIDLLTIFLGVMMGAPVAEKGIAELSKAVAENAVTRLPRVALTKTAVFPIAAQIAKMVGSKYTKSSFAKGVGRFIPLAGGLFSGGLTLYTFRKGANRLRRQLRAQRHLFDDGAIDSIELSNIKTSFVKANKAEQNPQLVELAVIQAMINIAKINDEVSPEKYHFIEQRVARAKIDAPQKLELIGNIESDKSYDVDFDLLSTDREAAQEAYENMEAIVRMDEKTTMAQKIYLNMAAQKLGISN